MLEQDVRVFPRSDAPEQDRPPVGAELANKLPQIPLQWLAITRIVRRDIDFCEILQLCYRDGQVGGKESAIRRDDENASAACARRV